MAANGHCHLEVNDVIQNGLRIRSMIYEKPQFNSLAHARPNYFRLQRVNQLTSLDSPTDLTSLALVSSWLSLFNGLDYWTGLLDWTTGLDYWTGLTETASGRRKEHQWAELRHPATKFVAVL